MCTKWIQPTIHHIYENEAGLSVNYAELCHNIGRV